MAVQRSYLCFPLVRDGGGPVGDSSVGGVKILYNFYNLFQDQVSAQVI
jgi:hypothetical protein